MLSVAPVSTGQASSGYYKSEGYYADGSEQAKEASFWHGQGSEVAGLSGQVNDKDFDRIMQGFTPDGDRIGKKGEDGTFVHEAGTDLTFSAPKSVSVLALISGDVRLIVAHDQAVKKALDYVEANYLKTRIRGKETGHRETVGSQKLVAGVFRHDANRNLDAHLHSHAIAANMTIGEDGKWRSVGNKPIFNAKLDIGLHYRTELASRVTALGYEITRDPKDGTFDITAIPENVLTANSSRRAEILAKLAESDHPGSAKAAARAVLLTRSAKPVVNDRAALYETWKDKAGELGFTREDMAAVVAGAREKAAETTPDAIAAKGRADASFALNYAIMHISEREAVYEQKTVLDVASKVMKFGTPDQLDDAMKAGFKSGELVRAYVDKMDSPMTDRATINSEKALLYEFDRGKDAGAEIATHRFADRHLNKGRLNELQSEAVRDVLTSKDRFVGIQGYAGVGKTHTLSRLETLVEKRGYEIEFLAPTLKAVDKLNEDGLGAKTLAGFLTKFSDVSDGTISKGELQSLQRGLAKTALVVDEASFISTEDMTKLDRIANDLNLPKVVKVGDVAQQEAVGRGSAQKALMQHGMKTSLITDIMRQKNETIRNAVYDTIKGDVAKAFDRIGDSITEHGKEKSDVLAATADAFLALSPEERSRTMLITQSNDWRRIRPFVAV